MSARAERIALPGAALGVSAGLHLLAFLLAATPAVREALASWRPPARQTVPVSIPVPEERVITVPIVETVPAPKPPDHFLDTDGLPEEKPEPGRPRFISDRDTRARSATPEAKPSGLTAQEGVDIPVVEVIQREHIDGEEETADTSPQEPPHTASTSAPPQITAQPPPTAPVSDPATPPKPSETRLPQAPAETARQNDNIARSAAGDIALSRSRATPPPSRPAPPRLRDAADLEPVPSSPPPLPQPRAAQTQRRATQMRGAAAAPGAASVDAENTASGRYMKQVTRAIEQEWHRKRQAHADFVTYGTIKLEFYVNKDGQVESLQIKNRDGANAVMQDFTLNAVLDAKIPPMPPGLSDLMPNDRMLITYDIIVY